MVTRNEFGGTAAQVCLTEAKARATHEVVVTVVRFDQHRLE